MSLIWTDSFLQYTAGGGDLVAAGWNSPTNVTFATSGGRFSGQRYLLSNGTNCACNRAYGSNMGTNYGGISYWQNSNANLPVVRFFDGATVQASIYFNGSTGKFLFYRGDASTLLGTSSGTFAQNTWNTIEWILQISNSISANQGRLFVNANASPDIDLAATTNTRSSANNYATIMGFFGTGSGANACRVGDMYLDNAAIFGYGPQIRVLNPNNNGNSNQFTNSNGNSTNNYTYVDDDQFQSATYVQSSTVGHKDLYEFEDLPFSPSAIGGIGIKAYMLKMSPGARTARLLTRSDGVDYEGSDIVLAETAVSYAQFRDVDPDTAAAWTEAGLNAAQFGVKVEA